jgi:predicted esterase
MQHHKLKVAKTAHYYTLGQPTEGVKYFWFVTHGYGQLASHIIRKFEIFDSEEHYVVAPEALNRFYWKFMTTQVGASWMTREDRLDEIEDYTTYLIDLFNQCLVGLPKDAKIILFGFSQGCVTQIRWILRGLPQFDHLILWGGALADDIDYEPFNDYLSSKKIDFVCGNTDEFITLDRFDAHIAFAEEKNIQMDSTMFEGKHEILTAVLQEVFDAKIK